ncbi:hypothetical protein AAUPMC_10937 [Pasteurella multocida subsp. multocida str. Anand1_cattle]|nr:hypothetical protein AAUPMC_10937 [Pasteurella multocida subsp. multocida str. Anand1_cattle]
MANEEQSNTYSTESHQKKSFFQSLFGRFFQGELKNREELVEGFVIQSKTS